MARALLLTKDDTATRAEIGTIEPGDLPPGDVTVDVAFSTLNYKDALAITGKAPIVRHFPMVPGIDFAGTVAQSSHQGMAPGDRVVLNGWGLGETRWGGMAELARVQGDWLVPLPAAFSPEQAMAIGTAGYTAMLAVLRLEEHGVRPDKGPLLVTGASGGVGSVAIALLARLGYEVWAMTGRPEQEGYLRTLGAAGVVARADYRRVRPGRWPRSAGPAGSTPPAARSWRISWPPAAMAASSPAAGSPPAWSFPPRWRPSSSGASRWRASKASTSRGSAASRRGSGSPGTSIRTCWPA